MCDPYCIVQQYASLTSESVEIRFTLAALPTSCCFANNPSVLTGYHYIIKLYLNNMKKLYDVGTCCYLIPIYWSDYFI